MAVNNDSKPKPQTVEKVEESKTAGLDLDKSNERVK